MAFARTREARIGQTEIGSQGSRSIQTNDIESSYRLVMGASSRLETLEGNLSTMLDLAQDGSKASVDSRKTEEIYGKLRSLSAGFDQVVEAIRFKGETIFTEKEIQLDQGTGSRNLLIDPVRLLTYGENSLNLSESIESADVAITYRTDDQIMNSAYPIVGLDMNEASYISGSNPALELESGDYKIAINYLGANSTVEIHRADGGIVERQENVDLSGSGSEWVDFDVGVRISFEKEQLLQGTDKYDFQTLGAAKLSATLKYERIEKHVLRTTATEAEVNSAEFIYNSPLKIGNSSLTLSSPEVAPISTGQTPLESGNYNIEIEYQGSASVVRLTDELGRLQAYKFGIDLSANGDQQVDFGNGLSFNLNNTNFTNNGSSINTAVKFTRETPAIEEFDFREYATRIREALLVVQEQRLVMAEAQSRIEDVNRLKNSAQTSTGPSSLSMNAASAMSLLGGGGGSGGLFGAISGSANLGVLSTQLFQTTSALPTQANQSPQQLAQLQANSNTSSILSYST